MKYIILLNILLISNVALGQNDCAECEKFNIVGVYDFGPPPGGNWIILLLTVTEDLDSSFDPFYSDLFFVNSEGDTITKPIGPSLTLPRIKSDTIPYLMELNTDLSNQDFPIDFVGELVIRTPTGPPCPNVTWCNLDYSTSTTNLSYTNPQKVFSTIYPNPTAREVVIKANETINKVFIYSPFGELLKTKFINKKEEVIDLSFIDDGLILIQLIYGNNKIETHRILKTR